MADEQPKPAASEPRDYTPKPPKQVRDQLAQIEQMRADMDASAAPPNGADAQLPPSEIGGGQPPPPDGEVPSSPPPAEDGQSWEQRARSTAGRLEQERKLNQALSDRLQHLENTVTSLQLRGSPEPTGEPQPKPKPKYVTDEEARDYGDEFLTVVGKRAREEYAPEFEDLADRLRRLEGRVEGVGTVIERTQTNDVYGTLVNAVPNWRDINRSPEFKGWLQYPDPYSGRKRHDMLLEAFSGHDSGRVVRFFQGFLSEAAGLPQNPNGQGSSAPPLAPPGNGSGKPTLEDFAAPGRARSAPQQLPPDKPMYTSAWIAKFTQDKLRGVYRGREADADAIERDIFQAQHEGRIH